MVMEFMPDGCLYELLHVKDDIQLTDEVKKSMIRQLAGGLAYLHHDVSRTGLVFELFQDFVHKFASKIITSVFVGFCWVTFEQILHFEFQDKQSIRKKTSRVLSKTHEFGQKTQPFEVK